MSKQRLESAEQATVIEWAMWQKIPDSKCRVGDFLISIPNEGKRSPWLGRKMKETGLKPGVSDLFLAYPIVSVHGLWIEMKRCRIDYETPRHADRAVSSEQQEWIRRMNSIGYWAIVCYGADEAIEAISNYLGIKK